MASKVAMITVRDAITRLVATLTTTQEMATLAAGTAASATLVEAAEGDLDPPDMVETIVMHIAEEVLVPTDGHDMSLNRTSLGGTVPMCQTYKSYCNPT